MPQFLRYTFPGDAEPDGYPGAEIRARAMAAVFLLIPEHELTPGRLDTAAILLTDRGTLDYTAGDPIGEQLAPWLRLVIGPAGRKAWLDVDIEAMAAVQRQAIERRRRRVS